MWIPFLVLSASSPASASEAFHMKKSVSNAALAFVPPRSHGLSCLPRRRARDSCVLRTLQRRNGQVGRVSVLRDMLTGADGDGDGISSVTPDRPSPPFPRTASVGEEAMGENELTGKTRTQKEEQEEEEEDEGEKFGTSIAGGMELARIAARQALIKSGAVPSAAIKSAPSPADPSWFRQQQRRAEREKEREREDGKDMEWLGGLTPEEREEVLTQEVRLEARSMFEARRRQYVVDAAVISVLGFSLVWMFGSLQSAFSFLFGGLFGVLYTSLLSNSVANANMEGGGVGGRVQRLAIPAVMFLIASKRRDLFEVLSVLAGFVVTQQGATFTGAVSYKERQLEALSTFRREREKQREREKEAQLKIQSQTEPAPESLVEATEEEEVTGNGKKEKGILQTE
uniref:Transmembrane protein n=1 Tax=Chromera velia CCMP2878 TaxID=1169474 RepID=A0A0G4HTM9_9ALVE|eukprot:Cvel_8507.t1-p1 / transcript=Cvel_8507.t1 / gene=Cvel_8507 / organism=Chromera_velia_CCMP2878 / gene_product=hypothetical protein / transcript_product=hypothetical protein / location=Cvel_scaffold471:2530-5639(+) / protein_length=398 / sequence_SO=supercontig / SO=protein_coding / is_pseudo=false